MDTILFHSWLENGFNKSIIECHVKKLILLLIDEAKCHISIQTGALYPSVTHLIQLLDLVLINTVKTNYQSEVSNRLRNHPSEFYDKCIFVQVFKEVWLKLLKVKYPIKGFEESRIYLVNLDAIKKGKLTPAEVYKRPEPLPEITDDSVIISKDGNKEVLNQDPALTPSTLMVNLNDDTPLISTQKTGNMIITVGKRKFKCIPIKSVSEET